MRVGIGWDVHKLVKGRKLIIGGVRIPFAKGLLGHSDADVLVHAIMDALLGAASMGDIGRHFPPTEKKYKDISSISLLKKVNAVLKASGFKIRNIDSTVIMESPKIGSYSRKMASVISKALAIPSSSVNIK